MNKPYLAKVACKTWNMEWNGRWNGTWNGCKMLNQVLIGMGINWGGWSAYVG